jgi:hypothetical protein
MALLLRKEKVEKLLMVMKELRRCKVPMVMKEVQRCKLLIVVEKLLRRQSCNLPKLKAVKLK